MNISNQLRAARLAAGLTQAEVATRLNTSQASIARLENPHYTGHTLSTIARYATAVGCTVSITIEEQA